MTEDNELKIGTKYGASKPQPSLVPYDAIAWLARVLEYGAAKYARGNWQKLDSEADRIKLLDALERHVGEFKNGLANGEKLTLDGESKMPTIAHVLCNAVFLTFFVVRDGISGSNPLELTSEQRQALADAKALGQKLAAEAKANEGLPSSRPEPKHDSRSEIRKRLERDAMRFSLGGITSREASEMSGYTLELVVNVLSKINSHL